MRERRGGVGEARSRRRTRNGRTGGPGEFHRENIRGRIRERSPGGLTFPRWPGPCFARNNTLRCFDDVETMGPAGEAAVRRRVGVVQKGGSCGEANSGFYRQWRDRCGPKAKFHAHECAPLAGEARGAEIRSRPPGAGPVRPGRFRGRWPPRHGQSVIQSFSSSACSCSSLRMSSSRRRVVESLSPMSVIIWL